MHAASTRLENIEINENYTSVITDILKYRVYFLNEDIIRIRASFDGEFIEASYALIHTAWKDRYDEVLADERVYKAPLKATMDEKDNIIIVSAGNLSLWIKKSPFAMAVKDQDGKFLYKDLEGRGVKQDHLGRRFHYFELEKDDAFYGFGETTGPINKAGRLMDLAPKDAIGYDPEYTTNMYKHIPFFIKVSAQNNIASGYFYHNFWNNRFNLGAERSGYWHPYGYFESDGGDIDLFVINGPSVKDVVKRYTDLTGKSAFMPLYSLGYLGSTMYYVELDTNCGQEILDFVQQNLSLDIPIDGFQLSSGYTVGEDTKRYVLTWNDHRFPNPKEWFSLMNKQGVTVSPNVKPALLLTHPKYDELADNEAFIRSPDGKNNFIGPWWGGQGSFIDFTHPSARAYWKKELSEQLLKKGTSSIWNDNCEYEIDDVYALCHGEGWESYVGALRSFQSNMMCYTTHEAIKESCGEMRPYIVCRSGASGIQRYAQTWCGDNRTSWRSLKYNIATMLNMGLSGVANQGADVGGFQGRRPEAELLLRWVQNGIFMPRFSIHSCNDDNTVTEPWMYEDVFEYIKKAMHFRYEHIPYIYSLLKQTSEEGMPIMRPLIYDFQSDKKIKYEGVDFMFGPFMLVSNIVEKGEDIHTTYLPKGKNWYRYNDRMFFKGGQKISQEVDYSTIPIYLAEGTILPTTKDLKRLQKDQMTAANILFIPSAESYFCWYQDDGKTDRYKKGDFLKTHIQMKGSNEKVIIDFQYEGNFQSSLENVTFEIVHIDKGAYWVEVDGRRLLQIIDPEKYQKAQEGWRYDATAKAVKIKLPYRQQDYQLVVSFEPFDLIGMIDDEGDF